MATLLKRLSMNLERRSLSREDPPAMPGSARAMLPQSPSFNDFSMHVGQDVHDHVEVSPGNPMAVPSSSFASGAGSGLAASAPAGMHPFKTGSLKIPRTSVAQLLRNESSSTPRSSLEVPSAGSVPTPRSSLGDDPSSPRSPRSPGASPTTPGGRRRRPQKIDGMDYYEFCELIRSSSL